MNCELCNKPIRGPRFLSSHMSFVHGMDMETPCRNCDLVLPSHAAYTVSLTKLRASFVGIRCLNGVFSQEHMEKVHLQKQKLSCHVCGKLFNSRLQVETHTRVHHTEPGKVKKKGFHAVTKLECHPYRPPFLPENNVPHLLQGAAEGVAEGAHGPALGRVAPQVPLVRPRVQAKQRPRHALARRALGAGARPPLQDLRKVVQGETSKSEGLDKLFDSFE